MTKPKPLVATYDREVGDLLDLTDEVKHAAAMVITDLALDAAEARELLAMCGLLDVPRKLVKMAGNKYRTRPVMPAVPKPRRRCRKCGYLPGTIGHRKSHE